MKKDFVVGLIGGIINGIIASAMVVQGIIIGAYPLWAIEAIVKNIIAINIIWGIIFAILYSKFYRSIPGKGIWKGLVYGLMLYFLSNIYWFSYVLAYGDPSFITALMPFIVGIWVWIVYGFMLGILYEKVIIK